MKSFRSRGFIFVIIIAFSFWLFDALLDIVLFWKAPFIEHSNRKVAIHAALLDIITLIYIVIFVVVLLQYVKKFNESEARYQQLFDNVDDLIYIQSPVSSENIPAFSDGNLAACQKLGYTHQEFLQLSPANIIPPENLAELSANMKELLQKKHILYETILVAKDGVELPVEINAHLVNLRGQPAILSIARDITERKRIEEILKKSEARFRAIFERAAIGIVYLDLRGRFFGANPAFQGHLGYTQEELSGRHLSDLTYPDDLHEDLKLFAELTTGKRDYYALEKRFICKDGQLIWCLKIASLVRQPDGKPQFVIGMMEDITARKRAENALLEAHGQLEKRVEERTRELAQANIELKREVEERTQAEAALRESKQQLQTLTSQILTAEETERQRIARELHDGLGQTLMLLKFKLSSFVDRVCIPEENFRADYKPLFKYLDEVVESIRRLSRDLSTSVLEELGLSSSLRYLLGEFTKHFHITASSIEMDQIDRLFPPETQINIYRIYQEILTNIARHAAARKISVAVKKHDDYVSFVVEDDGKGFDLKQIAARTPPERKVGLAAMQERARITGGSLELWSQEGSGTRVTFNIPVIKHTDEHATA